MNPDEYQAASELFEEVFDLEPEARARLMRERAPSEAVRREVEALLDMPSGSLLGATHRGLAGEQLLGEAREGVVAGTMIGTFRVVRRLGAGGMGVVYLAEQEQPRRRVAVKVMRDAFVGRDRLRRFELEAEFLGRLQHAGIAQVYEFGLTGQDDAAQMFLAMEFIEGVSINEFAHVRQLTREQRVELLIQVCDAVHHAHTRGVVHRDLKPSNVLVTEDGSAKIIDFGVARAVDREAEDSLQTVAGEIVGTLAYMSPEQVRGAVDEIDTRADVYALGVLSYELLSGRLPFDTSGKHISEVARLISDEEPHRLGQVSSELRGDLEWIVAQAMEKDAARRYQSAGSLAADYRRVLEHQPVQARPPSAIYQLRKIARRHRIALAGVAATLLAILVGAAVATHYAIRNGELAELERKERNRADERTAEAERLAEAARKAREEAERVGADLRRSSEFLSGELSAVDSSLLGEAFAKSLEQDLQRVWRGAGASSDEIEARLASLRPVLADANMVNVATETLRGGMFDPIREDIEVAFADDPSLLVQMLSSHARLLANKGLVDDAYDVYRRVLEFGDRLPENCPELIRARIYYGIDLGRNAEWSVMDRHLTPEIARAREILDRSDDALWSGISALARARHRLGRTAEAETLYREALAGRQAELRRAPATRGRVDGFVLTANNLGALLQEAGRAKELAALVEAMWEWVDADNPEYDESRVQLLGLQAVSELVTGDLASADKTSEQAVRLSRDVYGDFHSTSSLQRRIRFDVLFRRNEIPAAKALMSTELDYRVRFLGPEHAGVADAGLRLAGINLLLEDPQAARETGEIGLRAARVVYGVKNLQTLNGARLLAEACRQLPDEDSRKLLRELEAEFGDAVAPIGR